MIFEWDENKNLINMRKEYDIKNLNPRKNPYAKLVKKQVTINLDESIITYFKEKAESTGIPYQTLINSAIHKLATKEI